MQEIEPTNLCETCRKELECFQAGVFEREICDQYEALPLDELLERDKFVRAIMVGPCPECGGESTYDCGNSPLLEDSTVGHCLDCETYWCLECGYVFESVKKEMQCPHWELCAQCSNEKGYLDIAEFMEKICPTCDTYDEGCLLDEPMECEKHAQFMCPYYVNVWDCPKIEEFLQEQS